MPKSDLEYAMWLEPWHTHCPYGKARVGSTSSSFNLKFGKPDGSPQAQSQQLEGGPYRTPGDLNWGQAISMVWFTMERSELSTISAEKTASGTKPRLPRQGLMRPFNIQPSFSKGSRPFFHPVLHMLSWVISMCGEGRVERNTPSLEGNFSFNRGVTNLEKMFHIEGGEGFI